MSGILAIGIGNPYRRDDGAGVQAVRRLAAQAAITLTTLEASGEGTQLMDAWQAAGRVLIFDAVRAQDRAGRLHRIDASTTPVPSDYFHYSTHAFSLAEAVELARALGELPPGLIIYGIEGVDFGSGKGLSPAVDAGVDAAVALALQDLVETSHA